MHLTWNGWPQRVPILSAKDIHRTAFDGPNGTHCLEGWVRVAFGLYPRSKIVKAVHRALFQACDFSEPWCFNDDATRSKRVIARAWNRAMKSLGYVVGNPEL